MQKSKYSMGLVKGHKRKKNEQNSRVNSTKTSVRNCKKNAIRNALKDISGV